MSIEDFAGSVVNFYLRGRLMLDIFSALNWLGIMISAVFRLRFGGAVVLVRLIGVRSEV